MPTGRCILHPQHDPMLQIRPFRPTNLQLRSRSHPVRLTPVRQLEFPVGPHPAPRRLPHRRRAPVLPRPVHLPHRPRPFRRGASGLRHHESWRRPRAPSVCRDDQRRLDAHPVVFLRELKSNRKCPLTSARVCAVEREHFVAAILFHVRKTASHSSHSPFVTLR